MQNQRGRESIWRNASSLLCRILCQLLQPQHLSAQVLNLTSVSSVSVMYPQCTTSPCWRCYCTGGNKAIRINAGFKLSKWPLHSKGKNTLQSVRLLHQTCFPRTGHSCRAGSPRSAQFCRVYWELSPACCLWGAGWRLAQDSMPPLPQGLIPLLLSAENVWTPPLHTLMCARLVPCNSRADSFRQEQSRACCFPCPAGRKTSELHFRSGFLEQTAGAHKASEILSNPTTPVVCPSVLFAWGKCIPILQSQLDLAQVWQDSYPEKCLIILWNGAGAQLVKRAGSWSTTHPNAGKAVYFLECQQEQLHGPTLLWLTLPQFAGFPLAKKEVSTQKLWRILGSRVKRSRWEKISGSVHITRKKCFFACSRRITKSQVPRQKLW